jgi:hypothetical protein
VLLANYRECSDWMRSTRGGSFRLLHRQAADGGASDLTEVLAPPIDTLILISFDSLRTRQAPAAHEVAALRAFLGDADHSVFVCPHHDIGDVDDLTPDKRLAAQEVERCHHGDPSTPPQQRFGNFARALLAELGVPVVHRFGLHPAAEEDGSPAPLLIDASADRLGVLRGVSTFNLHAHLPHFADFDVRHFDVLARQRVSSAVPPHPFGLAGNQYFNALLQSKPGVFAGTLLVGDATLWSSTAGGLESLRRFWRNVATSPSD